MIIVKDNYSKTKYRLNHKSAFKVFISKKGFSNILKTTRSRFIKVAMLITAWEVIPDTPRINTNSMKVIIIEKFENFFLKLSFENSKYS